MVSEKTSTRGAVVWEDVLTSCEKLPTESEQFKFLMAFIKYQFGEIDAQILEPTESWAWCMQGFIERMDKSIAKRKALAENGAKGGRGNTSKAKESKLKQTKANESKLKLAKANESKRKQIEAEGEGEGEGEYEGKGEYEGEKEGEGEVKKISLTCNPLLPESNNGANATQQSCSALAPAAAVAGRVSSGKARKKPPVKPSSADEVAAYCEEKGLVDVDANAFFDYYESQGWIKRNGLAVRDWRATARAWQKRELERHQQSQQPIPSQFQRFENPDSVECEF
jgi:hypothetical protein